MDSKSGFFTKLSWVAELPEFRVLQLAWLGPCSSFHLRVEGLLLLTM